ncbi:hypothetical protein KSX49_05425 [Phocaeicola dorei]|uniref:Uncharacterized protein n=3 Tax=Bacteroidaceae TaxID=815 RepID=A0AAP2N5R9_PHOVU|nr:MULTISPECIES: hypothetical protein [Phocaeicola]MBV0905210.1 hypothetical protein [Phocaeicola vulgatus]MBV3475652.1 hypothetical protein [Phocaeicola vulgatus]MBV3488292.1 hypothetical protein [Phocaeicola vulgatus]MBV3500483.1 hypothetical protein [Phocaeicola vulgatus]MBV3526131.1 hypothetical protein [Phocaeicola vulgatus]
MSASDEALKVNIYPTGNAFTRNPIFLSVSSCSMATYSIRMNNEEIFKGNGIGEFRVNIAEIVETGITGARILPDNMDHILAVSGLSAEVTIHVVNEGEEEDNLSFTAWKGGISKKEFKRLRNMGTDIFSLKFLNESCNFFFTTRSNDWRIMMRETELYPLCFIYPEHELKITELLTGQSLAIPGTAGNFYALNLEAVRLKFFTDYGVLANLFDVYSGDTFALRIGIEQSPTVREHYRLRFLNSYGTYEVFSLEGEASVTPGMDEDEDAVFRRYDEITDDYYSDRIRTEIQEAVTIKTGFKRPQEIRFLLDLLSSDDVYLSGYGQEEIKVIPSVEEFSYRVRPDAPQNVTLKLTFAEKESNWTGEITESGYWKPGVHSKEFSKQFN